MIHTKNPATGDVAGFRNIKVLGRLDVSNPTETDAETQSEMLAVRAVMKRFPVSIWHAQVICRLSGLGGAA